MLSSTEDAEDVLQEAFASAHRAMRADERPIVARAWLYRIARNRCLDHLRRPATTDGQDSMDVFERAGGVTSEDIAHQRAEIRQVMGDIRVLPEAQRSALLMREIDSLSHEQIAAMDTTVSSVKSLLVRARIALTEAARARSLTCDEVRVSLGGAAEGIANASPEARRHLKSCQSCQGFKRDLRRTTRVLAAAWPLGPLSLLRDLIGGSGAAATTGAASTTATPTTVAAVASGGSLVAKSAAGGLAAKAAAGVAAAAVASGGAVEIDRRVSPPDRRAERAALERIEPVRARTSPNPARARSNRRLTRRPREQPPDRPRGSGDSVAAPITRDRARARARTLARRAARTSGGRAPRAAEPSAAARERTARRADRSSRMLKGARRSLTPRPPDASAPRPARRRAPVAARSAPLPRRGRPQALRPPRSLARERRRATQAGGAT